MYSNNIKNNWILLNNKKNIFSKYKTFCNDRLLNFPFNIFQEHMNKEKKYELLKMD